MKITRANYEAWVIDYIERRLSEAEQAELHVFLAAHPDLAVDFDLPLLDDVDVTTSSAIDFSHLRVASEFEDRELWLAAVAEGDLTGRMADAAREDSKTRADIAVYSRLRLSPDVAMEYPDKSLLRKPVVLPLYAQLTRYAAAAAAFALLIVGAYLFNTTATVPARLADTSAGRLQTETRVVERNTTLEDVSAPIVDHTPVSSEVKSGKSPIKAKPRTVGNDAREPISVEQLAIRPVGRTPRIAIQPTIARIDWSPAALFNAAEGPGVDQLANREDVPEALPVSPTRPLTATEFFASRAQERITGRTPEQGPFLRTLADRALERVDELSNGQVAVARTNAADERKFKLKLGPVTIER